MIKCNLQYKKQIWKDKENRVKQKVTWCRFFDIECHDSCIFAQQVKILQEIKKLVKE